MARVGGHGGCVPGPQPHGSAPSLSAEEGHGAASSHAYLEEAAVSSGAAHCGWGRELVGNPQPTGERCQRKETEGVEQSESWVGNA